MTPSPARGKQTGIEDCPLAEREFQKSAWHEARHGHSISRAGLSCPHANQSGNGGPARERARQTSLRAFERERKVERLVSMVNGARSIEEHGVLSKVMSNQRRKKK